MTEIQKLPYNTRFNLALEYIYTESQLDYARGLATCLELLSERSHDGDVMCIIGDLYENGKGVEKDIQAAIRWYKRASEENDTDACLKLVKFTTGEEHKYYIEKALRISLDPTSNFSQTHPATVERTIGGITTERVEISLELLQSYFQRGAAERTRVNDENVDIETIEVLDALIADLEEEGFIPVTTTKATKDTEEITIESVRPIQESLKKKRTGTLRTVWNWITWN